MVRLTLELPEDIRQKLVERAAEAGVANVEDYVQQLLAADTSVVDPAAPSAQSVASQDDLEAALQARLDNSRPDVAADDAFWEALRQHASRRGDQTP